MLSERLESVLRRPTANATFYESMCVHAAPFQINYPKPGMTDFQLASFDCDGVLVDSERITNRVFCEMLNKLSLQLTLDDMFEYFVGLSIPQCVSRITQRLGHPPSDDFLPALHRRTATALQAEVTPVTGVRDVPDGLRIPARVASSGEHAGIRLTLQATGLLERFSGRNFSVEDVEHPKPAPDAYLHAFRHMQIEPAACAVIKDTPTAVRAGVAAGHARFRLLPQAGAYAVFADMRKLPGLLQPAGAVGAAPPARR